MLEVFKFCKTREVKSPVRGTDESAGIDFFVPTNIDLKLWNEKCKVTSVEPRYIINNNGFLSEIILAPGESVLIPSGIHITLPKGYMLKFENKSGVAAKKHSLVGSSVVDSDYFGEIHINLHNVGTSDVTIVAGEKIIQGILYKIELPTIQEYSSTEFLYADKKSERGAGGFGSTGTK